MEGQQAATALEAEEALDLLQQHVEAAGTADVREKGEKGAVAAWSLKGKQWQGKGSDAASAAERE